MSWGFFTHNYKPSQFLCNAVDLALLEYDYYWPMDDGDRGSVVPATFYKAVGPTYTMSSSVNVGDAWDSGAWDNLNSADLSLSPFTLCSARSVLTNTFLSSNQTVLNNVSAGTDIRGFHHTAILVGNRDHSYTIDVNQDWLFTFSPTNSQIRAKNPRLGVNVDHLAGTVTFAAAYEGGSPTTVVSYDNTQPVIVVTVFFPNPAYASDNFSFVFDCYINDETPDTVSIAGVPAVADVTFDAHNWMYPFRNGTATWLGLGIDFNATSKHADVWQAVLNNTQ